LKKSFRKESQETQQKPQPEELASEIRNLENRLFQQMTQIQQPMQPEVPQPEPVLRESTAQMQSPLELAAAAMRVKLEQNRRALQEQGIQSASDKIKQFSEQQK
jgi:hypothetical protein